MLRRLFRGRDALTEPDAPARPEAADEPDDTALEAAADDVLAIDDVDALVTLVLKSRGAQRDAALAHPLLASTAALTRLEKRSRHKDKSVNRHARRGLDRYRQLSSGAEASRTRAEELAAALRRTPPAVQEQAWRERQHQLHEHLEAMLDEYRGLAQELSAFGHRLPELESLRVDPRTLPALEPAEPAAAAVSGGVTAEPEPARADPFEALVQGFRELDDALGSGRPFSEVAAERQTLTDRWLTAADHSPPSEAQHQVFETVSHRFRELADAMERLEQAQPPELPDALALDEGPPQDAAGHRALWQAVAAHHRVLKRLEQVRRQVRWPSWAPPSDGYARLVSAADSLGEALGRADTLLASEIAALDEQISALTAAIDDGSLKHAQSLLARARALHDALPAPAIRAVGRRLGKQAARLAELKDWQTFATSPKRQSLADAMDSLAAEPLEPLAQADRIKELRRQWQALGPVTQAADGRLADRFNAAAEKAFEPCRAYFADQAEVRKANLAERRRICDQLEQYLDDTDWASADMKGAEKIMRAARDEWRRFHPVDRNPGKSAEARFERLQGRLHDLVKAEWDKNLAAKQAIVAEAEALLGDDRPMPDKVAEAKRLQARWRDVGTTPRRPDQQLWRAFRSACDGIFSAREHSRQVADAALDQQESSLAAALDAFAGVVQARDAGSATEAELRSFRQDTADVDRLPQSRRRPLATRRTELLEAYGALLDAQRRAARRQWLLDLARWDEAMTAAEAARTGGGDAAFAEPPEGGGKLLEARLAAAGEPPPREDARRLAVKAELAAGLGSPAEDEPLRLEVQVERLQAGLSGGDNGAEDPRALAEAWCRLGPKDDAFTGLRERLFAALTSMLG